jgi:hypothetical protein
MRTTITLDDDVVTKLKSEMRKSGCSFKETVNAILRLGLNYRRAPKPSKPFVVRARRLGLRIGLNYDNVGDLLEQVEGPRHR